MGARCGGIRRPDRLKHSPTTIPSPQQSQAHNNQSGAHPSRIRSATPNERETQTRMRRLTLIAAALALFSGTAAAQSDFPIRPITVIVPFAAGGPTDTVARLIAEPMTRTLGQQVIVENVAGAGGTLAAGREARADPDGYTLLVHHIGLASSVGLYRKLPYDPATAFAPIGRITDVPMTVVGKADFPPGSVGELLGYIRAHGEEIIFAHGGVGAV